LIADMMLSADTGRIAIVDRSSNSLVGLVTRKDLLHLRRAQQRSELERQPFIRAAAANRGLPATSP
jgi:chloride channel protein, CIC family